MPPTSTPASRRSQHHCNASSMRWRTQTQPPSAACPVLRRRLPHFGERRHHHRHNHEHDRQRRRTNSSTSRQHAGRNERDHHHALRVGDLDDASACASALDCSSLGNGGTLTTDASGNVVCAADDGGSGSVGGSDTQVQFNDGGSLGADSGLTYNKTADRLTTVNASTTNLSTSYASTTALVAGTSILGTVSAGIGGTCLGGGASLTGTRDSSPTSPARTPRSAPPRSRSRPHRSLVLAPRPRLRSSPSTATSSQKAEIDITTSAPRREHRATASATTRARSSSRTPAAHGRA